MIVNNFYKNGFIIKSEYKTIDKSLEHYRGVACGITWPLDTYTDPISVALNNEALSRWFGYQDNRLWVIPDKDYLTRYFMHCKTLNIQTSCFQIESSNSVITTCAEFPVMELLGYDYVDVDMNTSCLFDELFATNDQMNVRFQHIRKLLNKYGMFSNIDDMNVYLNERNQLLTSFDTEEYYSPTVVRFSEVLLNP